MKNSPRSERRGEIYALALSLLEGLFPILSLSAVFAYGPITAYLYTITIATLLFLILLWRQQRLHELWLAGAQRDLLLTSLFITLLFGGIFIGLRYTSPANVAVIMVLQLFFSYLYFHIFGQARMKGIHTFGALLMGSGALSVLIPKNFQINPGDAVVLFSAAIAPLANYYQQRAREHVAAITIMGYRNLVAIPFLLPLAFLFETPPAPLQYPEAALMTLITALLVFVLAKTLWIEALYHISVTRLSAMAALIPLWTLFFSYLLLDTVPSWRQFAGGVLILAGALLLTRKLPS